MLIAIVTGGAAGAGMGYVLMRAQLCFHAAISNGLDARTTLARGWTLGVALAACGLSVLLLLPGTEDLNRGLAFRPVANVVGGLVIGAGMVVAQSCVSGLFYKLGSGMVGAAVGLVGWAVGELSARELTLPGPTLLSGGPEATLPGLLGLPHLLVAVGLLAVVLLVLRRGVVEPPTERWQWGWRTTGLALGVVVTGGWALAAVGGATFGPSTVGAVASISDGAVDTWLVAFLLGIVAGAFAAARTAGGWWLRGEEPVRYAQLVTGGFLLGAGGWIAGGCNLGHGLSGAAQLNVSSFVVVAAMVAGVALARRVRALARRASPVG